MSEQSRSIAFVLLILALVGVIVVATGPKKGSEIRQFTGVWSLSYETSYFEEGPLRESLLELEARPGGWLTSGGIPLPIDPCRDYENDPESRWDREAFEITFIGRRVPGPSGHLGQYPAEYFVEEVIEIERIGIECETGDMAPPR